MEEIEHGVSVIQDFTTKRVVICKCGAQWSHPLTDSSEKLVDIMNSHVKYFNRPKTEVL